MAWLPSLEKQVLAVGYLGGYGVHEGVGGVSIQTLLPEYARSVSLNAQVSKTCTSEFGINIIG